MITQLSLIILLSGSIISTSMAAVNSVKPETIQPKLEMTPIADEALTPITPPLNKNYNYSFADIVEPLIPAVVNIYTVQYSKKPTQLKKNPFGERFPFDHLNELLEQFNIPFNLDELYSNPKSFPLGSGFLIDAGGYIVTNHHVISNADEIHVKLTDNTELSAKIIGVDKKTDLALLKIEPPHPLPFVQFGDSNKARVGDWVIAIGNPFGRLGGTVTAGIISSKGRDIELDSSGLVDDFIQTDAAIHSGNSGGPMFNVSGEVIGVNTAIFSPSGTNIGIGFAIPANKVKTIVEQLKKDGKISRGRLGVVIQEVTNEIAEGLGLKDNFGALVTEVQKNGPGDKAGLKAGDIIVEFAGQAVKNSRRLQVLVAEALVNQEVKIVVIREGKRQELSSNIKDEEVAEKDFTETKIDDKNSITKNNISFSNLTDELRQKYSIKPEVNGIIVINIIKDQKSYGFKLGDIIVSANQQPIKDIEQLNTLYEKAKQAKKQNIVLLVQRRNTNVFIPLPII